MNPVNVKKLQHSKWTAIEPAGSEKHFLVTSVHRDEAGNRDKCIVEAVFSRREIELPWRELADPSRWRIGWH